MWDEDAFDAYLDGITEAEPDEFTELTRSPGDHLIQSRAALDTSVTRLDITYERASDSMQRLSEALRNCQ